MENGTDSSEELTHNFELNSLKEGLNIDVSKSSSTEEGTDWGSKTYNLWTSDSKISPRTAFPLSREALHEQLFGVSELRKDVNRSFSTTDVPEPFSTSFYDMSLLSPSYLQAPKSSPGVIGANYSPKLNGVSGPAAPIPGFNGFGDRTANPTPPPLDVTSRYVLPPALNVYNQPYGSTVSNSFSSSSSANNTPMASSSLSGKFFAPNASNPSIAISPSYHAHYAASVAAGTAAVAVGSTTAPIPPPPAAPFLVGRSPRISPVGNGRENPNLHYRPNRDVQIANLAKARAAAEAAAGGVAAPSVGSEGASTFDYTTSASLTASSSTLSFNVKSRSTSSDSADSRSSPVITTTTTSVSTSNISPPSSYSLRKPTIQYVYKVMLKTTSVQCLISPSCSLTALSMNELIVFQTCDEGSGALGEEIGFVSHIQTMRSYLECQLSSEQEAVEKLKQIVRVATEADRRETARNRLEEANIAETLTGLITTVYHLPISIVDVQYQLDRRKLTVCFRDTSEGGVGSSSMDGREMLRDLYQRVQTRIVMKRVTGSVSGGGGSTH